jgi:outer membrane protein OmpA-like peptidoglycan-associated protein
MKLLRKIFAALLLFIATGCYGGSACNQPAPGANAASGSILGAALGAGSGAVVGHQLGYSGEGALIGAAFGLVSGFLAGYPHDINTQNIRSQRALLEALREQTSANARQLAMLQGSLDRAVSRATLSTRPIYTVYFDPDSTSVRAGSIAALQTLADQIKLDPGVRTIHVSGHSDDSGSPEYNERVSESRARNVRGHLGAFGLGMDRILIDARGSVEPVASNATSEGRQLNRRVDIYVSGSY